MTRLRVDVGRTRGRIIRGSEELVDVVARPRRIRSGHHTARSTTRDLRRSMDAASDKRGEGTGGDTCDDHGSQRPSHKAMSRIAEEHLMTMGTDPTRAQSPGNIATQTG